MGGRVLAGCPRICTDSWGIGGGKEFRIKFSFRERACGDVGGRRVHSLSVASQTRDGGGALARHGGLWYNSAVFGGRHRRRPREVGRTRSRHADLPRRTTGGRGSCTRAFGASCALARGVPSWNAAAGVAVCVLGGEVRAGDAGKRVAWEIQALARQRGGGAEMGGGVNEIRRQMDD